MRVDVVIPVYNGAALVARAVQSVLGQSVDVVTSIQCIDDASTDDSRAVLDDLAAADDRVRVLREDTNRGVAAARNRGVRESASELIAFIDQDDEWMPDKLERQLAALEADAHIGYAVGRQRFELDAGTQPPAWTRPEWFETPRSGFLPSALLVRRTTFERIGFFDESYSTGGDDTDWFARARRLAIPCADLDDVVMVRHVHGINASSSRQTDEQLLRLVRQHVRARSEGETP